MGRSQTSDKPDQSMRKLRNSTKTLSKVAVAPREALLNKKPSPSKWLTPSHAAYALLLSGLILLVTLFLLQPFRLRSPGREVSERAVRDENETWVISRTKEEQPQDRGSPLKVPAHLKKTCLTFLPEIGSNVSPEGLTASLEDRLKRTKDLVAFRRTIACTMIAVASTKSLRADSNDRAMLTLDVLAAQFFTRYILASKAKDVVYFHHVSKAGGSGVCAQAWVNGCRPPGDPLGTKTKKTDPRAQRAVGGNCWNEEFKDRFTWWPGQHRGNDSMFGCLARRQFAREVGLNFMANEGYLPESMDDKPCSSKSFLTVEMLREPIARSISHLVHAKVANWHLDGEALTCFDPSKANGEPLAKAPWSAINMTCLASVHYIITDNYQVRMLAGRSAYERPRGQVTREELDSAKVALRRFDVLNLIQARRSFQLEINSQLLYQVGLGFIIADRPSHIHNARAYESSFPEDVIKYFTKANNLDLELFNLAEDLYELDSFIYNRTATYCRNSEGGQKKFPYACGAFEAQTITSVIHPNSLLEQQRNLSQPYSCGCGWAGSNSGDKNFQNPMAILTGSVAKQSCPRKDLFDRRGIVGDVLSRASIPLSMTS